MPAEAGSFYIKELNSAIILQYGIQQEHIYC